MTFLQLHRIPDESGNPIQVAVSAITAMEDRPFTEWDEGTGRIVTPAPEGAMLMMKGGHKIHVQESVAGILKAAKD